MSWKLGVDGRNGTARTPNVQKETPEDVYKSRLDNNSSSVFDGYLVVWARQNLASSFLNGLVIAAFGQDKQVVSFTAQAPPNGTHTQKRKR